MAVRKKHTHKHMPIGTGTCRTCSIGIGIGIGTGACIGTGIGIGTGACIGTGIGTGTSTPHSSRRGGRAWLASMHLWPRDWISTISSARHPYIHICPPTYPYCGCLYIHICPPRALACGMCMRHVACAQRCMRAAHAPCTSHMHMHMPHAQATCTPGAMLLMRCHAMMHTAHALHA